MTSLSPPEESSALSLERGALTVEGRGSLATCFFVQRFYPKEDAEAHGWIFEALK